MAEVICIPATVQSKEVVLRETRVAAYCRVSSLPQEESYASQVEHFTSSIQAHPGWRLVHVYGDEGVTGLNTRKRKGFQQMIKDGRNKKFDLLLVKSISRLGRNTVDLLQCVRELRAAGVNVFFEKENLSTDESAGELMITLLSAFAQMESESISANVRIGLAYKMQRGEWSVAFSTFLGYDRTDAGEVVINLEQAETVRRIFNYYLDGLSLDGIAKRLTAEGRMTGTGTLKWNKGSIQRILQNRKYSGDVVLQMTIVEDLINKKRVMNIGQSPQYVVVNGIPPIISRQMFYLAQGEMERRGRMLGHPEEEFGPEIRTYKNGFTGKLRCKCGGNYNKCNAKGVYVWKCYYRVHGKCRSEIIKEAELEAVVLRAAQMLWDLRPSFLLQEVPFLTDDSSPEELMEAAKIHMENRFLQQIGDFLDNERPVQFDAALLNLVVRIDLDGAFTVIFFDGSKIVVERDVPLAALSAISAKSGGSDSPHFGYMTKFHVTGEPRKRLVQRLAALTGEKVSYLGFPSMAFMVGDYYVSSDGTVMGRLSKRVLRALARAGFVGEQETLDSL